MTLKRWSQSSPRLRGAATLMLLVAIIGFSIGRPALSAAPPNVVVVLIDDMGYADLSCFGGRSTRTENIDRLATQGMRFTHFYSNAPICSPSRVALHTGRYPFHYRINSYLASHQKNVERSMPDFLPPEAPSLPRTLQRAGYHTGHFGKWHMGGQRDVGTAPTIDRYGFDRHLTNFEGLGPRVLGWKTEVDGKRRLHSLGSDRLPTGPIIEVDRHEVTHTFVDAAIDHIEESQSLGKPFYVNLWPDDVHAPFYPAGDPRRIGLKDQRRRYEQVLDEMDRELGRLFDRIAHDAMLRDNTVIALMSDNGHDIDAGTAGGLRGGKTWLYEGGIRSPLIIWAPTLMASEAVGTVNSNMVAAAIDLNRSLYSITGTSPEAELDGEDLSQTLLGHADDTRQKFLAWRRPVDRPGMSHGWNEDNPDLAIRDGRWKYVVNTDGSGAALFDLRSDGGEHINQISRQPDIADKLHRYLQDWNEAFDQDDVASGDATDRTDRP